MPIYASFIKPKELKEVLRNPNPHDRVIAVKVDTDKQTLTIMSLKLAVASVPLKTVDNSNVPYRPDYTDVEIIDHGYGIRFGTFEVAADWALWACGIWNQA